MKILLKLAFIVTVSTCFVYLCRARINKTISWFIKNVINLDLFTGRLVTLFNRYLWFVDFLCFSIESIDPHYSFRKFMFYICMFCDALEFRFITSSIASIIRFKHSCFILCIDVKSCLLTFDICKIFFKRKICCKIQHILGMKGLLTVRINNLYSKIK